MNTMTASEAARRLGSSLPRVLRAIGRLGLDVERGPGGRVRMSEEHLRRLEAELGAVVPVEGLSRVETQVLAALARTPRGVASVRAVARRAVVSPAAASGAISRLSRRGLVRRDLEWVAAGRARRIEVIRADVAGPEWPHIAPLLARTRLPAAPPFSPPAFVPDSLGHLFWNARLDRLPLAGHGGYVADRLLSTGDLDGLAWGAGALKAADWEAAARDGGLSERERSLARNLARSARA